MKNNSKVKSQVFRIILIIIAGLTVGLSLFSWNAAGLAGNQMPMPFGLGTAVVLSGSMEPELKVNDLVFVTQADDYEVGQIVVYQLGKTLVIHRIVSLDGEYIVTKGDANNTEDEPVTYLQVKGVYRFKIPFVGMLVRFIKTVPGTLIVFMLAMYLLLRSRRKEREKDDEDIAVIAEEIKALRLKLEAETKTETVSTVQDDVADDAQEPVDAADGSAFDDSEAERDESAEPAEDAHSGDPQDEEVIEPVSFEGVEEAVSDEGTVANDSQSESVTDDSQSEPVADDPAAEPEADESDEIQAAEEELTEDELIDQILDFNNEQLAANSKELSEEELIDEILAYNNEQNHEVD